MIEYLLGLATLPALLLLKTAWWWLTYKNQESSCMLCDRVFGEMGVKNSRIATLQFYLHRPRCRKLHRSQ